MCKGNNVRDNRYRFRSRIPGGTMRWSCKQEGEEEEKNEDEEEEEEEEEQVQ